MQVIISENWYLEITHYNVRIWWFQCKDHMLECKNVMISM